MINNKNVIKYRIIVIIVVIILAILSFYIIKKNEYESIVNFSNNIRNLKNYTLKITTGNKNEANHILKVKDKIYLYHNVENHNIIRGNNENDEYITYDTSTKIYAPYMKFDAFTLIEDLLPNKINKRFNFENITKSVLKKEKLDGKNVYVYKTDKLQYIFDAKTKLLKKVIDNNDEKNTITYEFELNNVNDEDVEKLNNIDKEYKLINFENIKK